MAKPGKKKKPGKGGEDKPTRALLTRSGKPPKQRRKVKPTKYGYQVY